jgi:hypothetical protein
MSIRAWTGTDRHVLWMSVLTEAQVANVHNTVRPFIWLHGFRMRYEASRWRSAWIGRDTLESQHSTSFGPRGHILPEMALHL